MDYYAKAWLPARDLVVDALNQRLNVDPSGHIILFEQFAPWKVRTILVKKNSRELSTPQEHLFEVEAEQSISEESKPFYILYPDETGGNWRIQAVPVSPDSFDSRKALPEVWRGLRDDKLSEVSEIDGGIFVHASGFIGGQNSALTVFLFTD